MAMLTKDLVSKLLNRPLTSSENDNFDLYIKNATNKLQSLIGMSIKSVHTTKSFVVRQGYRTVFTDVFTGDVTVTVDGVEKDPTTYTVRQNDSLDGDWFNSIVFKQHLNRTVEYISVEADYGFGGCLPSDLQLLLAKLFDINSKEQTEDGRVANKKIEDYSIAYKNESSLDILIKDNQDVIDKYSIKIMGIRNGSIC